MHDLETLFGDAGLEIVERDIGGAGQPLCTDVASQSRLCVCRRQGTLIAAKEYRPEILRTPHQIQRIRQEADIGAKLQHPHVVRTFGLLGDLGSDRSVGGPLVLLLEWVDGLTLDAWYFASKPVPWATIRKVSLDLTSGVAELHGNNVFHRDIKPKNAMVRAGDATAVMMDTGVAELGKW